MWFRQVTFERNACVAQGTVSFKNFNLEGEVPGPEKNLHFGWLGMRVQEIGNWRVFNSLLFSKIPDEWAA